MNEHKAKLDLKDAAVQTEPEPESDYICSECQLNALELADTPVAKASHDELKLHILPMLDDKQGGRIIFVHGDTAAARTECVNKALQSLRVFDFNRVNIKVSE